MTRPLPVGLLATMVQGMRGGIGRYVFELARRLEASGEVDLEVLCLHHEQDLLPVRRRRAAATWNRGGVADVLHTLLRARPPEGGILHCPSYRRIPWSNGGRVVATVHDLAPLHMRDKYGQARHLYLARVVPIGLRNCAHVVAVTEHTRLDLIERFELDPERVTTIWNGVDHQFMRPGDRAEALARCRRAVPELARDFVLFLARVEHPGKGHVPLLEAWAQLAEARGGDVPQLVFAGQEVERADEVRARARDLGLSPLFLGRIDNELVPDLYRACLMLAFPSLYEGFGLPTLEAMACGAPVAASRQGALAETAGPAAELEPHRPEQMAAVIGELLDDGDRRARLAEDGRAWSLQFDWDRAARETLDVYRAVASS